MAQRLTKSRFVLGLGCPQKLVYARAAGTYRNTQSEDAFLAALADGGFQVGEFAKCCFPGGVEVSTLNEADALAETNALLAQGSATIFEAAILWENCLIRVDVLEKAGDCLRIHEVKAKSFDSREPRDFLTSKGMPSSTWAPYLYDVAFQKYVVRHALPEYNVTANLMLADKAAVSPVDGLHQCFRIVHETVGGRERRRAECTMPPPPEVISAGLLKSVPVDVECDALFAATTHGSRFEGRFADLVAHLSAVCEGTVAPRITLRSDCGKCEFQKLGADDPLASGFEECIATVSGGVCPHPGASVFDVWDFRKKDRCLAQGIIHMNALTEEDVGHAEPPVPGQPLTRVQRQWLQVEKCRQGDTTPHIDREGWAAEVASWRWPLHFIDFETTRVALPFFAGQRPYQNIAFQFSHHRLAADGTLTHANQFLCADPNRHPNIEFVRALKAAIGSDAGSVFMYSKHENTTLRDILDELEGEVGGDVPDRDTLVAFLKSLVTPKDDCAHPWTPTRPMVDLLDLVKRWVYLPSTHGSNSLKAVLPAILNASKNLQARYSQPIYGRGCTIPSLNIEARSWITYDETGAVRNPYELLPDLSAGLSPEEAHALRGLEAIKEGGAALTAYGRLMYEDLSAEQRGAIEQALLEYCELDTLAMVFLVEGVGITTRAEVSLWSN